MRALTFILKEQLKILKKHSESINTVNHHFSLNRVGGHFEQYSGSIELLSLAYFIASVALTSDPISKVQRIQMILDQLIMNYLIKINN